MTIRVGINGLGRIGRCALRAIYDHDYSDRIKVVAINSSHPIDDDVHLIKYDTTHGRFNATVTGDDTHIYINDDPIRMFADRNPANLAWGEEDVDVVMECTGQFKTKADNMLHIEGGAKKVLISAPGADDIDATVVYGVNHDILKPEFTVVSNASCTTNCLAPMVKPLHEKLGLISGLMTTIHAYTNDQKIIDNFHHDRRRARAAAMSIIPTKSGAAKAVGLVLPDLNGHLDGYAMRVPTINVSCVDLTFNSKRHTTIDEVNSIMKEAAGDGVLEYNDEFLVSTDFNHHPASSIFDATLTKARDDLVKVTAWYDNEWGFSVRMLDTAIAMMEA
ncbi:MAG: type I glyceraldehyde-3-phosphate dehydrogenase [Gammaproteobacteria bacterium]|nr:MAG: type I glyceraldehyde-3-phosphate dehydrogenase [Gammaproteobacteria bacterium]